MRFDIVQREMICSHLPTAMCHASTVLPLSDGTVLCAWFGGSQESKADVAIWTSRREEGRWTDPAAIVHMDQPHWNPVLQRLEDGIIRLYYKVGINTADWKTMICDSKDMGRTWSMPRELVLDDDSGGRGPVRSKIIRTSSGRYLAPCSTERGVWIAYADYSDDGGLSWTRSNPIMVAGLEPDGKPAAVAEQSSYRRGVIQPTLWEKAPNKVHMLLRSTEGKVFRSDSEDDGATWCKPYPISLPNNNSGIDLDCLSDGTLILACNPVSVNWGPRTPLRLLWSKENGVSWHDLIDLDSGNGEFSYPAVVARGMDLYVTYTWKRQNIAYWHLQIEEAEKE